MYCDNIITLISTLAGNWDKLEYCSRATSCAVHDIHTGGGYPGILNREHIGTVINTDGIQPFKSSRLSIYPVFLAFAGLPPSIRMMRDNIVTLALWVGEKPLMNILLKPVMRMLRRLSTCGIQIKSPNGLLKTIRFQSLFGVFDLIARAPAMNMKQHNGYNGCPVCLHPGTSQNHTHVYLPGSCYPQRTHNSIVRAGIRAERDGGAVDGIKGQSPLALVFDLVKGIPIDYMHCVLEGVTKKAPGNMDVIN